MANTKLVNTNLEAFIRAVAEHGSAVRDLDRRRINYPRKRWSNESLDITIEDLFSLVFDRKPSADEILRMKGAGMQD